MDVIELAQSSRSRCRECRKEIDEGELRFGTDREGMYGDGAQAYGWYHPRCAARRLPERLLKLLMTLRKRDVDDYDALVAACSTHVKRAQSKYPYGERAPTGRARCIECNEPIAKDAFRVAVEREIVTGAFTRMGAAYLHPACAVANIGDPALGELLAGNSPLLSPEDGKALAAECDAAAAARPAGAPATQKPRPQREAPAPREDRGAELVLADELMERGDVRGELIVVESELASVSPVDPRRATLDKRAAELRPKATRAWKKELGKQAFTLERGLPMIEVPLTGKTHLPDARWLLAVHARGGRGPGFRVGPRSAPAVEPALASLMQEAPFARVRRLKLSRFSFTWEGLRGFCACDEVKNLEALDLELALGARALLLLLGSTRFERLTELTASTRYALEPNTSGFEAAAGLPALRALHLPHAVGPDIAARLLRSPLAQRLEVLGIDGHALGQASLPRLRRLILHGFTPQKPLEAIARNRSLGALEVLDLGDAYCDLDEAVCFADPEVLPSLKGLVLDSRHTRPARARASTLESLRKRFGEGLVAGRVEVVEPAKAAPPKAGAKKKAKTAKKTAGRRRSG